MTAAVASVITIQVQRDLHGVGYTVTVLQDGEVAGDEWFTDWRKAQHAAGTIAEQFDNQGLTAEVVEINGKFKEGITR